MDSLDRHQAQRHGTPRFDDRMVNIQESILIMAESLTNGIMDAQAEDTCADGNQRNDHRERTLVTSASAMSLRIPNLRWGSYFPDDLLIRYSRVEISAIAEISEMATCGMSTRKMERVTRTMGIDRMDASRVSHICETLDATASDLQTHDLSDVALPYIWPAPPTLNAEAGARVVMRARDGHRREI